MDSLFKNPMNVTHLSARFMGKKFLLKTMMEKLKLTVLCYSQVILNSCVAHTFEEPFFDMKSGIPNKVQEQIQKFS